MPLSASLLGSGGVASVPVGATAAAPAVLYDSTGVYATKDTDTCSAYVVTNTELTNWLWIRMAGAQSGTAGTPIMPGESQYIVGRSDFNTIGAILAWGTTPGVGGTAVAVVAAGGFVKRV